MGTINLGKVRLSFEGAYSSSTAYEVHETVYYSGETYACIQDTTAGTAPTNTTYWVKLVQKGADGADGATGPTGATGATGSISSASSLAVDGFVTTDGIIHTDDSNTYVKFLPDRIYMDVGGQRRIDLEGSSTKIVNEDTVKLQTGSTITDALVITNNQNVSIPNGDLTVTGDIEQTTGDLKYTGGINWNIDHYGALQNIVLGTTPSGGSVTQRVRVAHNGDVSFYEDTGSTAKFFWDASAESLGIGTSSASTPLAVHNALNTGQAIVEFRSTGNSNSTIDLRADGTGDPRIHFDLNGATPFAIGVDNSDGDKFKISGGYALGTNDRFVIDSSGQVGIGTSSPQVLLQINDTGTAPDANGYGTGLNVARSDGLIGMSLGYSSTAAGGYIQSRNFTNSDTNSLLLNPLGGNVGIGVDSPSYRLDTETTSGTDTVASFHNPSTSWGEYALARFQTDAKDTRFVELGYYRGTSESNRAFVINGQSSNRLLTIEESTGNVGIGTSLPSALLETEGSVNGDWVAKFKNTGTTAYGVAIDTTTNSGVYNLACYTNSGTGMFVRNDGKVGIGTSSPSKTLDVEGSIRAKNSAGSSAAEIDITSGSTWRMRSNPTTGTNNYGLDFIKGSAGTDVKMSIASDGSTTFSAGVTAEGLTINGGGSRQYINSGHLRLSDGYNLEWGGGTNYVRGSDASGDMSIKATGHLTLDVADEIHLDADSGIIRFRDDGGDIGMFRNEGQDFTIRSMVTDKDMLFKGQDGSSTITALTLNMSEAGEATFNSDILLGDGKVARFGSDQDFRIGFDGSNATLQNVTSDSDIIFKGQDGSSTITALTLDMSAAGAATFNSDVSLSNGDLTVSGNVTAYSDSRLKEDIRPIENAVSKVQQISGNTYTRNDLEDTERRYAGVIAQEIEQVLPEAVSEAADGTKAVDYNATIALLIEAVKELTAEVEELKGGR